MLASPKKLKVERTQANHPFNLVLTKKAQLALV
jgi:hypothetical protein